MGRIFDSLSQHTDTSVSSYIIASRLSDRGGQVVWAFHQGSFLYSLKAMAL